MSESQAPSSGSGRLNTGVAHNARVWNYWIGGKDNYEVDQAVGDQVAGMFPVIREVARADREFLDPGLVSCTRWHPGTGANASTGTSTGTSTDSPTTVPQFGAVAVKP